MSAPFDVDDDLEALHDQRMAGIEQQKAQDEWDKLVSPDQTQQAAPALEQQAAPAPLHESGGITASGVVKDVGRGIIESPEQAWGGFTDAIRNTSKFITDFQDPEGKMGLGKEALAQQLASVDPADSVTGSMIRSTAQFLTGFFGTGKLKAVQNLATMGKAGAVAAPMLKGMVSDFAAFDPQAERLSNLVQQFPALQNPVTEYLAADPADGDAEGRFKNMVEGAGLGLLTNGLASAVGAIRSMKQARAAAGIADDEVSQVLETAGKQRVELAELIGDASAAPSRITAVADIEPAKPMPREIQGEISINFSRIQSDQDVKSLIQDMANSRAGSIDKARRGVVTWEETKLSASQLDAWKILQERQKGQPLNNEQTMAVRELWVRSGKQVKSLADQVRSSPGDLNKIALRRAIAVHNAIQEQVIPARTETARALNAWAIPAGDNADFASQMKQLQSLIANESSIEDIADKIGKLSDAGMDGAVETFLQGSRWAKTSNMINQLFYFSRLSSPFTHARNLIGNSLAIPLDLVESKTANIIGKVRGSNAIPDGETTARMFGYLNGVKRALRTTAKGQQILASATAKHIAGDHEAARQLIEAGAGEISTVPRAAFTGQSGFGIGKVAEATQGAFDPTAIGIDPKSVMGRFFQYLDTATNAPSRALSTSDELFKTMAFDAEMNASAFRQAHQELSGGLIQKEAFRDRVAEILSSPDEYMKLAARKAAEVQTFSQQPLDTRAWRAWKGMADFPVLGKLTIPFKRTPFNIATFTFQRTPLAPLVKSWREDIMAGGARADKAWSRFVVGNTMLLAFAELAMDGHITGEGPSDPEERATLTRGGWQPNSVKIQTNEDDKNPTYRYFSYRGLEPLGTSMGLAANVVDILQGMGWEEDDAEAEELAIAASMAVMSQVTSQSYMSGAAALFDALSDPRRYGENYFERLFTIPIPLAVGQVAKAQDPTVRMTESIMDSMRAQIPGLSKDLPPRRDLWGRPVTRSSGLGGFYDAVSPIYSKSTEDAEPIDKELNRIELYIPAVPKMIREGGVKVSLKNRPEIYSRYVELAGNVAKIDGMGAMDTLNQLVTGSHDQSDLYAGLPDGPGEFEKGMMIEKFVDNFRRVAQIQLIEEFPELKAELDSRKGKRALKLQSLQ